MNGGILKISELRATARGLLLGKYGRIIFIHFTCLIINAYMNELTLQTRPGLSTTRLIMYIVLSIIVPIANCSLLIPNS